MNSKIIKILFILCVLCPPLITQAQNEVANDSVGIKFMHESLAKAFETASVLNKPVFIDCYTTWCGPCKYLSTTVFPDKRVGDFYNEHFICIKLDMEKGEGLDIAKKYDIKSYPTLLFLDSNGEIMHKEAGSRDVDNFIRLGQKALDPKLNSAAIERKIKNGEVTPETILYSLANSSIDNSKVEGVLNSYFKNIPEANWADSSSWSIMSIYSPLKSKYGQYILKNDAALAKKYGQSAIENSIARMISTFYYSGYRDYGYGRIGALHYIDSLKNPLVEKARMRLTASMGFSLVMQDPSDSELWTKWFDKTALYQMKYENNKVPGFPELVYLATNNKSDIKYICETIQSTKHNYVPSAIQAIQFAMVKSKFTKEKNMMQSTIDSINVGCEEILKNCNLDPLEANNFAWAMVEHQQRDKFLQVAKKLSAYTLTKGDSYFWLDTYATICAQLLQFDEAIKFQGRAVEARKKQSPGEDNHYQERYDQFVKHKTLF